MGLEKKLFPHSILHPPAPLLQPGSVFKDVTTNSNRLQKGKRATVRLGAVTSKLRQQALKVFLQVQVKRMSSYRSSRKEGNLLWSGGPIWGTQKLTCILKGIYKSIPGIAVKCSIDDHVL